MAGTPRKPPRVQAREALLHRIFKLSSEDQVYVYRELQRYLRAPLTRDSKAAEAVERRERAIELLQQVAAHLKLPAGAPYTAAEFDRGARDLSLDADRNTVVRAWATWKQAMRRYQGQSPRESQAQRAIRTAFARSGRTLEITWSRSRHG